MDNKKYQGIIIIGGPGAGKGTLCNYLSEKYNFIHLSIGDILREERKKTHPDCIELNKHITEFEQNGTLMGSGIAGNFLIKEMKKHKQSEEKIFLIDGFVKRICDYEWLKNEVQDIIEIKSVLFLECDTSKMLERLSIRVNYSNRLDDNVNIFEKRIQTYIDNTHPAVEYMKNNKERILVINSSKSIEEVRKNFDENIDWVIAN